jgi:hypothetical protein
MIKTGTFIVGALLAIVSFSAPSFAQSVSQYDMQLQRVNDIRQQTTDTGLHSINRPVDRAPSGTTMRPSQRDVRLQSIYMQRDETLD